MAQTKSIRTQEYDSIVIGGGLSGLIIAHQLEATGRKVALVEALETLGGDSRPFNSPVGRIDHGLKFFPNVPSAEPVLMWLEQVLGKKLNAGLVEAAPVTYDNGKLQPFVGFGDQSPLAVSEISYYTFPQHWEMEITPKDWVTAMSETFTGDIFLQSHATKLQVDDQFVIEILVNGAKRLSAREYVFCANPQQLLRLLPEAMVPSRFRQKLSKGQIFTSVHLDLFHPKEITDSASVHILKGGQEEPCLGMFHPVTQTPDGPVYQHSQWTAFLPSDQTEDNELVANALKHIKRQVKRVYADSLDNLVYERILVCPASHGEAGVALTEDLKWPKIDNLWVASSFFSAERNLIGALSQSRAILANMIGDSPEASLPVDDETDSSPTDASH